MFEGSLNQRDTMFYLTAEANVTAEPATLARSKSLTKLAERLEGKDGEFWGEMGWDGITLEEDGMPVLTEDLRGRLKRGELSFSTYKTLVHHCL